MDELLNFSGVTIFHPAAGLGGREDALNAIGRVNAYGAERPDGFRRIETESRQIGTPVNGWNRQVARFTVGGAEFGQVHPTEPAGFTEDEIDQSRFAAARSADEEIVETIIIEVADRGEAASNLVALGAVNGEAQRGRQARESVQVGAGPRGGEAREIDGVVNHSDARHGSGHPPDVLRLGQSPVLQGDLVEHLLQHGGDVRFVVEARRCMRSSPTAAAAPIPSSASPGSLASCRWSSFESA